MCVSVCVCLCVCWGWGGGGGSVVLRSVQQLLKLTLFELSIVSDFIKCVRLHNLPVLKDCVQQVLEMKSKTRVWYKNKERKREERRVRVGEIPSFTFICTKVSVCFCGGVELTTPYSSRSPLPSSRVTKSPLCVRCRDRRPFFDLLLGSATGSLNTFTFCHHAEIKHVTFNHKAVKILEGSWQKKKENVKCSITA